MPLLAGVAAATVTVAGRLIAGTVLPDATIVDARRCSAP